MSSNYVMDCYEKNLIMQYEIVLHESFREIQNAYFSKLESIALLTGIDFVDELWSKTSLE
jgi:hypothetical protein